VICQNNERLVPTLEDQVISDLAVRITAAKRPLLLLGGGLSRETVRRVKDKLSTISLPILTTWNGADRYMSDQPNYLGRPNTWGQRSSNLILQQADFLLAIGTRLGLQQTGFNWQQFIPFGEVVQVDIDRAELEKANPRLSLGIEADANVFLAALLEYPLGNHEEWLDYGKQIRATLPLSETCNSTPDGYLNPYDMVIELSRLCGDSDHIVPCSSGGAFTVMMQAFELRGNQTMITDKGLASMGYGLSGAMGVAFADPLNRTVLVEGDGGFSQNLQELATVAVNSLNIKIFLFCNEGYASIRMTQKNYFQGAYIGCDERSGLGFPDWYKLADAYGIPALPLSSNWATDPDFLQLWQQPGPALFIVPLHPEQSYFPKITSRVNEKGGMESNPLHLMSPELPADISINVTRFLTEEGF
jgi:acetolactate synthase-1/2/3 large subunit